jgi:hypothetical protein
MISRELPRMKRKWVLLNPDFERTGKTLDKDQFITKQMPYIMV